MTSPNVAVKHFVQEFLYLACNEDCLPHFHPFFFPFHSVHMFTGVSLFVAKLLCSLVGVGNAAGLLKEKGLLGNFAQFFQPHPVSASPATAAAEPAP